MSFLKKLLLLSLFSVLLTTFQNCGKSGFNSQSLLTGTVTSSSSISSVSGGGNSNDIAKQTGQQLYAANCASCHQGIEQGLLKDRSATQISAAFTNVPQMTFLKSKFAYSDLEMIALALSSSSSSSGSANDPVITSLNPADFPMYPVQQAELKILNAREYDASVEVMLGLTSEIAKSNLSGTNADRSQPFDNNNDNISISTSSIESYENVAQKVADAFVASATKSSYIPCTATGATDRSCLEKFVVQIASIGFRKSITAASVKDIVDLALSTATSAASFDAGVKTAIKVILQDPQFIYRFESGALKNNYYSLTDLEYLSRITYFILGTTPTLQQIKDVEAGALKTSAGLDAFITKLLNDPKAVNQLDNFHSMWFGFSLFKNQTTLISSMRTETKALIEKTFSQNFKWTNLLSSTETYADATLAQNYNLSDKSTGWKWRTYIETDLRQGLLSHGTILSVGNKSTDTSTTGRGFNISKALFCGFIGKPLTVDENGKAIDPNLPPPSDVVYECKEDLYKNTLLKRPACLNCHKLMDEIGFGLENFNPDGTYRDYRATELNKINCKIKGQGEINVNYNGQNMSFGSFKGPKQLADIAINTGQAEKCMAQRVLEFSGGVKLGRVNQNLINKVYAMNKSTANFKEFLKKFILSDEFRSRDSN